MLLYKIPQLIALLFVFLGALSIGCLGAFKIDVLQQIFPRTFIQYIQISIGLSAVFLLIKRFL